MGTETTRLANGKGLKFGGKKITPQMQRDAVKWAKEEMTTSYLGALWGLKSHQVTQILYKAAVALREAVRAGLLK